MQSVITSEQAKKITGGRTPLMPIEYEEAIKNLEACFDIDDTKYWDNYADALAAWAKMHRSNDALMKAKKLKLHAFKKMGELAAKLRPREPVIGRGERGQTLGSGKGPRSLLLEHGLSGTNASAAMYLARLPQKKFDSLLERPHPPSPILAARKYGENSWSDLSLQMHSLASVMHRLGDAKKLAMSLALGERQTAKKLTKELIEWLDGFEQALGPK